MAWFSVHYHEEHFPMIEVKYLVILQSYGEQQQKKWLERANVTFLKRERSFDNVSWDTCTDALMIKFGTDQNVFQE